MNTLDWAVTTYTVSPCDTTRASLGTLGLCCLSALVRAAGALQEQLQYFKGEDDLPMEKLEAAERLLQTGDIVGVSTIARQGRARERGKPTLLSIQS